MTAIPAPGNFEKTDGNLTRMLSQYRMDDEASNKENLMPSDIAYYLKINGLHGEVKNKPYDGWIKILNYWFSKNALPVGAGAGTSPVNLSSVTTLMPDNNLANILLQASASGWHFSEAIVAGRKGNVEFMRLTLTEIYIGSFQTGDSLRGVPIHTVEIVSKKQTINHGSVLLPEYTVKPPPSAWVRGMK